jgi:hypothetical protein
VVGTELIGQATPGAPEMSDPPATIAKRLVYPFPEPVEKRRSG